MTINANNERRKALLAKFIQGVWCEGQIELCDAYLADTYTMHHDPGDPWDGQILDLEGFKTRVRLSRAPFPDQKFHIRDLFANDGKVILTWHWTATHAGDYPGFPATGKPITMSGATVYYFNEADKITGHWQVTDRLGVYHQLRQAAGT